MKQTGGLYPAPLKILEVSLVVIIILMQTFSPVLLILRSRERFEAVIFCVDALGGNQSKSNLFHF